VTWREQTTKEHRSSRQKAARWLRPVMVAALLLRCANVFGAPAGGDDQKFDHALRDTVKQGSSSDRVQVIVSTKPGTRARVLKRVVGGGGRVNGGYALTDAVVANLSKGQARKLAKDGDVVAISSDAPVFSDGLAVDAVGAAGNFPYTLRGTLGLDVVSSVATTKTFAQGANGYAGGVNGYVTSSSPLNPIWSSTRVGVMDGGLLGAKGGMLVRFDGLFGDAIGRAPGKVPRHGVLVLLAGGAIGR